MGVSKREVMQLAFLCLVPAQAAIKFTPGSVCRGRLDRPLRPDPPQPGSRNVGAACTVGN